jgi:hypothetical protein
LEEGGGESGDGFLKIGGSGTGFFFGRHITVFEDFEDEVPVIGIGRESIKPKVALLFFGSVALEAVVFEEALVGSRDGEGGEENEKSADAGHGKITGGDSKSVQFRSGL